MEVTENENMGIGTKEEVVYDAVCDADIVIAGLEPYSRSLIEKCPKLKLISRRGIGYDSVDTKACMEYGVTLTRTFGAVEGAVAEHVMAYILYFARHIEEQSRLMHEKKWQRIMMPGAKGRTLGLIGFGGIGKEIAKRATAFGMNVVYNCRHPYSQWDSEYGVRYMDLDALLTVSDYVSLNVPLTEETRGMFTEKMFNKMKKDSVFINIARSQIVNVDDLCKALDKGVIRGAGIDVFDTEPCCDSPLVRYENVVLTPHTAPFTSENFLCMNISAAKNVLDFLAGKVNEDNIVCKPAHN